MRDRTGITLVITALAVAAIVAIWFLFLDPGPVPGAATDGDAVGARSPSAEGSPVNPGPRAPAGETRPASRAASRPRPSPSRGASTVTGNIVDAESGDGIAGARVVLRHPQGEFAVEGASGSGGAFVLPGVPGVIDARLFVSAAGFGPRLVRDVHVPPNDRKDLGTIALARGIAILGRVVSAGGDPVAGAEVDLLEAFVATPERLYDLVKAFSDLRRDDDALDVTASAADGTFVFANAAPGAYLVAAHKPGWQVRFSPAVTVTAGAAPPRVELRLVEAKGLRGVVRNEAAVPIAGATVAALEVDHDGTRLPRPQRTATSADGRFRFESFGAGDIAVIVDALGYSGVTRGNLRAGGDEIEITLRRSTRIEGRVFDRTTGRGLPGAGVVAMRLDSELAVAETQSGENGAYALECGPAGKGVTVFAKLTGYTMARVAEALAPGQSADALLLHPDTDFVPGTTERRDLPMLAGGVVAGRVVDEATGEGIPGADVTASVRTGLDFITFVEPARTRSAADGAFSVTVGPGKIQLRARLEGYAPVTEVLPPNEDDPDAVPEVAAHAAPVDLAPGGSVSNVIVKLRKGLDVTVLVTDPEGKPLPGARVTWKADYEQHVTVLGLRRLPREVSTDRAGKVTLKGVAPASPVVIAARHPDYAFGGFQRLARASASVTVRVLRGATLSGVVLDPDGAPAPARHLSILIPSSPVRDAFGEPDDRANATTDARGRFTFEDLSGGQASIEVAQLENAPHALVVDPSQGLVELIPGKREEIVVRLANPKPAGERK